ncbi:MAG: hypothetical protein AB7H90_01190 [Alphaproteobacteria bacterium]
MSEKQEYSRETIYVTDLVRGKEPVIFGKRFVECVIKGPVFMKLGDRCDIVFCSVPHEPKLSVTVLPVGAPLTGAVLLADTTFDRCFFDFGAAFIGTKEDAKLLIPNLETVGLADWKARRSAEEPGDPA